MSPAAKVMVTIRASGQIPTFDELCRRLSLSTDEIDTRFGVIELTAEEGLAVILVADDAARRIESYSDGELTVETIYANPEISPFDASSPVGPFGPPVGEA